jgi:hypothetical protein
MYRPYRGITQKSRGRFVSPAADVKLQPSSRVPLEPDHQTAVKHQPHSNSNVTSQLPLQSPLEPLGYHTPIHSSAVRPHHTLPISRIAGPSHTAIHHSTARRPITERRQRRTHTSGTARTLLLVTSSRVLQSAHQNRRRRTYLSPNKTEHPSVLPSHFPTYS